MTVDEAKSEAMELNKTGKHRKDWFYYPAWYGNDIWFVMRRPKNMTILIATYTNGKRSIWEHEE
ncbi:hypothetical protein HMSP1_92 [Sinorhizobium phage HMSP1-Susan]|nr:hypothetical protein HMSP1_92 [Sinorhizobium phage HMSP1-Susan]